jgi:hypothetical protein
MPHFLARAAHPNRGGRSQRDMRALDEAIALAAHPSARRSAAA